MRQSTQVGSPTQQAAWSSIVTIIIAIITIIIAIIIIIIAIIIIIIKFPIITVVGQEEKSRQWGRLEK